MKKAFWAFAGVLIVFFAACATTGSGGTVPARYQVSQTVPPDDSPVFEGEGVSLGEAIEQSAEKIAADLPAGSRVAIVAWESPSAGLSDYIMEELTGALVDRDMEVADRQNLEYVYRELNFQMSGEVSDESARSIGKFLGADLVITGQLTELGGPYRYRANAVNVESAARDSVTRLDVRGDAALRRMVTALANQKPAVKTASYGETEKAAPKTAGTFLDRGILFATRGDYELAIADFTEAIRLDPNYAAAYNNRGIMYTNKGDYDRAIADFTEAIRLDPNDALVYYNRGFVYTNKGDYDRAITDYTQAIRLDPNFALAYNNRGIMYTNKGDYDRAIADFTEVIRLDPNDAFVYYNRGFAYKNKGDYDRAITDYTQAIRLDPNDADAYNVLAVYDVLPARIRALRSKDQGWQNVPEQRRGNGA
ncbi:tetratricopeptide repeat protein [Treponema sp. TIM-1]|uniref:tetratricopeptide repeat protein n=1 Tax=Treponema sp. TIM-1 TaxID=2898417 RepID=UPI00397F45F2